MQALASLPSTSGCFSSFDYRTIHGLFMYIAWFIILPWGALAARHLHNRGDDLWIRLHRPLQLVGVVFTLIGVVLAFLMIGAGHLLSAHAKLGIVIVLGGIAQPIIAGE